MFHLIQNRHVYGENPKSFPVPNFKRGYGIVSVFVFSSSSGMRAFSGSPILKFYRLSVIVIIDIIHIDLYYFSNC